MKKKDNDGRSFLKSSKKVLASTLALSLAMSGTVWASLKDSSEKKDLSMNILEVYNMGDLDKNGNVDLNDVNRLLKGALTIEQLNDDEEAMGDVNFDGKINLDDVNITLKVALTITAPFTPTPAPTETEEPTTEPPVTTQPVTTPTVTPTLKPTPTPTVKPTPGTPTPQPTVKPHKTITAEALEPVSGVSVEVAELNGATYEDGIITFTDDNANAETGVKMVNPFSGKTELRRTMDQALAGQPLLGTLEGHNTEFTYDPSLTYPRPVWDNGASVSFWVRSDWTRPIQTNAAPILVFKNDDKLDMPFALMVRLNGGIRYEGEQSGNEFRMDNNVAGKNNQWNYYTITMANDWIQVYVNGEEVVFDTVYLKGEYVGLLNDGFMTRYNTIGTVTQEDVDKDIRNYITKAGGWYQSDGVWKSHAEYTIIGNGRYSNPNATKGYNLLMDVLTNPKAEMYIGGVSTLKVNSKSTGTAAYSVPTGTKVTGVTSYDKELTPGQIAANYLASYSEYKEKLGLE